MARTVRTVAAAADLAFGGAILVVLWGLGEGVARLLPWAPLPGSLWGMLLAFLALEAGIVPEARVRRAAAELVRWLGLLFVPVGVGVVAYGELVARHASAIAVAIVVGSAATLLASAAVAGLLAGRPAGRPAGRGGR